MSVNVWVAANVSVQKNILLRDTEVFPKQEKSVFLDWTQDHYHLITLLYLNIINNRAACWWKLIKKNQKKETEDQIKHSMQKASQHTDELLFQMLPIDRNNNHP